MTDAARVPDPLAVVRALPRGSAVILRDYDAPGREELARRLRSACAVKGVFLIVGADPALAARIGAKGVHLPNWFHGQNEIPPGMTVTASCHNEAELLRAARLGADLALLSPAFPTQSHPGAAALGSDDFRRLARSSPLPVLALGGVTETNAAALAGPNVAGLAAIGALVGPA